MIPTPDLDAIRQERTDTINCSWSCSKCQQKGEMAVWPFGDETPDCTAMRQQQWTRSSCLKDCQIRVAPRARSTETRDPV